MNHRKRRVVTGWCASLVTFFMVAAVGCGDVGGLGAGVPSGSTQAGPPSEGTLAGMSGDARVVTDPARPQLRDRPDLENPRGPAESSDVDLRDAFPGGTPIDRYRPPLDLSTLPTPPVYTYPGPGHSGCMIIGYDVIISEAADLDEFAGIDCFEIQGHLFVQNTSDVRDLDKLSGLRSVSGWIGISDNLRLKKVRLPHLKYVGGGLTVEGNQRLKTVEIDCLEETGGDLHIFNNQKLHTVSFASLQKVGGEMIFAGVNKLTKLLLPCLKEVGGQFIFEHSDRLRFLCLPSLETVGGAFYVHYNRDLRALIAPNLGRIGGLLEIVRNPKLARVELNSLTRVDGDIDITHNFRWAECQVEALVAQIIDCSGDVTVESNYHVCRIPSVEMDGILNVS